MQTLDEVRTDCETVISEEEVTVLVLRAQAGDAEAFGRLFGAIEARLHRQALFLAGNEQQALDLMQETMLEAWKFLARYDRRARFFTWVCSIMMHRHYDWLRRIRVRGATYFSFGENELRAVPAQAGSPSETADLLDQARLVRECLDQLPAKQRSVVYLRFYAGESLQGIAAMAGCSLGTVKSRLFHALERLAKMQKLREFQIQLGRGEE